jgi:Ca-activated chloride channel family protein
VLILQIQRLGTAYQGHETPIEIAIRSEPVADASAVPPPADKAADLPTPVHGASSPLAGGDSFNDAPEISSGVTYSDTVVTGESRYFSIPLQWGQRFSYLLTPAGDAQPELIPGSHVSVDVFNPVRQNVEMSKYDSGGEFWFTSGLPNPLAASTVYPARYSNRAVLRSAAYSLDGDYYLRLTVPNTDKPSSEGYLLTVMVSGEVEAGPVYQAAGAATASVATSTALPATTGTTAAAMTTTTPPPAVSPGDTATNLDPTAQSGVPGWVWAVVAAFAAGAVAALLLVRFRRRSIHPSATNDPEQQGDLR